MRKDQIFVLMLVILLPLTGCIGGIGDVDADNNSDTENAIVNNYFNNSTTLNESPPDYRFMVFDTELEGGEWDSTRMRGTAEIVIIGSFNTTSENMYSVVYMSSTCEDLNVWYSSYCGISIESTCDVKVYPSGYYNGASTTNHLMLKGTVGSNCTHDVYNIYGTNQLSENSVISMHSELVILEHPVSAF